MKKIIILSSFLMFPMLTSAATLSVSPSSQSVNTGNTFTVSVRLDTQGASIDGVDLRYLNFNPALLQVKDASASVSGIQIAPGVLMPTTILNSVDNNLGRISFSQVTIGGTKYTGTGILATITFKAVAPGTANLTFNYTPNNTTDSNVASVGKDVLTAVINGSYTLSGSAVIVPRTTSPVIPSTNRGTVSRPTNGVLLGTYVPLTDDSVSDVDITETTANNNENHSSLVEIISYIFSRIRNGFMKVFHL